MRPFVVALFVGALPLLVSAADPNAKELIVGKWKTTGATGATVIVGQIWEFMKDGTYQVTTVDKPIPGKYKFIDDNTMEGSRKNNGKEIVVKYKVKITGDDMALTFTMADTVEARFKRMK